MIHPKVIFRYFFEKYFLEGGVFQKSATNLSWSTFKHFPDSVWNILDKPTQTLRISTYVYYRFLSLNYSRTLFMNCFSETFTSNLHQSEPKQIASHNSFKVFLFNSSSQIILDFMIFSPSSLNINFDKKKACFR